MDSNIYLLFVVTLGGVVQHKCFTVEFVGAAHERKAKLYIVYLLSIGSDQQINFLAGTFANDG